jgi:SAM-dependent methyltransferase
MNPVLIRRVVLSSLLAWGTYALTRQCRKPAGWFGRRIARAMNISHARLTAWGLEHVRVEPAWRVLDIGCGGGQTIRRLAALASAGHVDGIDYSSASVAVARATNVGLIAEQRVSVEQGTVSRLPFGDGSFDLVTAVETHYYWPQLSTDLREILRVLKPGGRLLMIAETYKGRRLDWLYRPVMTGLLSSTYLTPDEHGAALRDAGFEAVAVNIDRSRGWICVVGSRPVSR